MTMTVSRGTLKRLLNAGAFGAGAVLFVLVLRLSGRSLPDLLGRAVNARPVYLLAVIASLFAQAAIVALRWKVLLGDAPRTPGAGKGFFFYASNMGLLMTGILPVIGNIGTVAASAKLERDVPLSRTVYAAIQGYAAGFVVLSTMLVPSALYLAKTVGRTAGAVGLGLAAGALIAAPGKIWRGLWRAAVSLGGRLPRLGPHLAEFPVPDERDAGRIVRLTAAVYGVIFIRYLLVLSAFDLPVPPLAFALAFPLGYAVSSLGVTPGNLGTSELGWFGALSSVGLGREDAVLYAIGQRVLNTGAILVLAGVSAVYYQIAKRRA
jgi:uncharacterized membrane protein YbhN (UPF0104 family)